MNTEEKEDQAWTDELKRLGRYDLVDKRIGTVDKPPMHYDGGIEPVKFIQSHNMDFLQGNVIKYVTRFKKKGQPIEDLNKARLYIDLMLKELEE